MLHVPYTTLQLFTSAISKPKPVTNYKPRRYNLFFLRIFLPAVHNQVYITVPSTLIIQSDLYWTGLYMYCFHLYHLVRDLSTVAVIVFHVSLILLLTLLRYQALTDDIWLCSIISCLCYKVSHYAVLLWNSILFRTLRNRS